MKTQEIPTFQRVMTQQQQNSGGIYQQPASRGITVHQQRGSEHAVRSTDHPPPYES